MTCAVMHCKQIVVGEFATVLYSPAPGPVVLARNPGQYIADNLPQVMLSPQLFARRFAPLRQIVRHRYRKT